MGRRFALFEPPMGWRWEPVESRGQPNHGQRQRDGSITAESRNGCLIGTRGKFVGWAAPKSHQHERFRIFSHISPSLGCVYTVVVRGLTWRAKRCARNKSLDAR